MTTPLTLITQSMKDAGFLGVGETPQDVDVNDAFRKLNWMLAEWAARRGIVYHLVEHSLTMTGAASYTIGPGGDIAMSVRPNKIDSAVIRQNFAAGSPVDFQLSILQAYEDWQRIAVKSVTGPPRVIFLDTAWPTGTIRLWPVPQANIYQLRILVKMILGGFTTLTEDVNLPPEYESAINWNLALRLMPMTGQDTVNPIVAAEAKATLRLIMNINAQTRRLQMPAGLPRRGWFDPISGVWY